MKKESGFLYRVALMVGDALAIVFAFAFAYYFRVHIDPRPYFFESSQLDFTLSVLVLLPIWLIILATLGLYRYAVLTRRFAMYGRLFLAAALGVMTIITYDFFAGRSSLFPVRTVALYAALLCFISLVAMRTLITWGRRVFLRRNHGLLRTVIVGNSDNTTQLLSGISPESGFKVVGVVAKDKYVPEEWRKRQYADVDTAIRNLRPDAVIHAEHKDIEQIHKKAVDHHASYYYSPAEDSIITLSGRVDFICGVPIIYVRTTPLTGGARVYKRATDLIFGGIMALCATPVIVFVYILQKINDFKAPAFYLDTRLTRLNRKFSLLKFRTIKPEYNGLTPEEAFAKMGKPELITKYREHGDYIKNDPRYTKLGLFLRRTSLDELPQLYNVVKGDISLIGPRALQPGELKDYGDRGLLLSVKSGLTGLAQVSGRRDISFGERRALDIYYVQNWTPALDASIFFRTITAVLHFKGAK